MIGKTGPFWGLQLLLPRSLFLWFRSIAATLLQIELLLLLHSCSSSPSYWALSSISTGDALFDSTKLKFLSTKNRSPITFEMMRFSNRIDTFIILNQFRFTQNPIEVTLTIGGNSIHDIVPVYEGAMRLRLSEETTNLVIQALQEGQEIDILVDGFEEKISPQQFPEAFEQFLRNWELKKYLKGPTE